MLAQLSLGITCLLHLYLAVDLGASGDNPLSTGIGIILIGERVDAAIAFANGDAIALHQTDESLRAFSIRLDWLELPLFCNLLAQTAMRPRK